MSKRSQIRIGSWSVHHPRLTLAAWIGFVTACVVLGAISGTKTLDNGAVGESARGYAIMNEHRLWDPPRELAYLHARRGPVPSTATRGVGGRFRELGLGLLGPLSQLFPVEDSAKTVVLLIGMAVGVDYALFFVVRSRAERSRGARIDQALETTLRTSGRAVDISGATVAIAMAGMYIV